MERIVDSSGPTWVVQQQVPLTRIGRWADRLVIVGWVGVVLGFGGAFGTALLGLPPAVALDGGIWVMSASGAVAVLAMLFLMVFRVPLWWWTAVQRQRLVLRSNQLQVSGVVGIGRMVSEQRFDLTGLEVDLVSNRTVSGQISEAEVWQLSLRSRAADPLLLWPMKCTREAAEELRDELRAAIDKAEAQSAGASIPAPLRQMVAQSRQPEKT